ncbi:isopentenyl transferase family protein [Geothrix alkalitolerans]|uniref:isopentenyl transferase family protein n=1 Tax=Geothrix alkalitolerans TaxID=2922724 RepID=UPI001FAEA19F|nr:isopentenyl transferase family protein [Geothrix alkalitolerans]
MPIAILGPTASGKSAVAVAVARRVGGTVVNGDPYQAIAGLTIGSGQPDEAERGGVPHLGYGELPLSTRPNPTAFGTWVRERLSACREPVLVTGSGLYLRGIWGQLSDLPDVPAVLVDRVRRWGAILGMPALHRFLAAVDPARAAALHPNDSARVQRALALHLASGQAPSSFLSGPDTGVPAGWRVLVVLPGRERQRERVAARVAAQVAAGWPREVADLVAAGHAGDLEALRPLGYAAWRAGGHPAAIQAAVVQETQAYAKRQATWFRNQLPGAPAWDPDAEPLEAAFTRLGLA